AVPRHPPHVGVVSLYALVGGLGVHPRGAEGVDRYAWQRRRPRVFRADELCRLQTPHLAAGLARAPSPKGPLSRRAQYRLGPTDQRVAPSRDAGGVAGGWRIRWGAIPQNVAAGGLALRV